jgi:hypothetical protein
VREKKNVLDTSNRICTANIGDGNPNSNFFASADDDVGGFLALFDDQFDGPAVSDPVESYARYDELVSDVLTVLMIAYSKNDTSYADTSLSCVSADTIAAGSRGFLRLGIHLGGCIRKLFGLRQEP